MKQNITLSVDGKAYHDAKKIAEEKFDTRISVIVSEYFKKFVEENKNK